MSDASDRTALAGIRRWRKKPIEVEAVQWHRSNPYGHPGVKLKGPDRFYVTTTHGQAAYLADGDWIIPEPEPGLFYPCKPDIFAAIYEPARTPATPTGDDGELVGRLQEEGERYIVRSDPLGNVGTLLYEAADAIEHLSAEVARLTALLNEANARADRNEFRLPQAVKAERERCARLCDFDDFVLAARIRAEPRETTDVE